MTSWRGQLRGDPATLRPVFVGGCSRSGTTLLGAMLGADAGVVTVPEAEFKWDALKDGTRFDGTVQVGRFLDFLTADPKFAYWQVHPPPASPGQRSQRADLAAVLTDIVTRYADASGKPRATTWIDHTPGNINHVPTLSGIFPDAMFVHIVRDGRAVAASVMPLDFGPNTAAEAADHWSSEVAAGLAAARHLGDDRVVTVRFEDLLHEPDDTLRTLCKQLDIPFGEEMVRRRDYRVQTYSAEQHALVSRPPDPSRAEAWRRQLSAREIEVFEARTGELLRALGYRMEHGITARNLTRWEHVVTGSRSAVRRYLTDRVRRHRRRRRPSAATGSSS